MQLQYILCDEDLDDYTSFEEDFEPTQRTQDHVFQLSEIARYASMDVNGVAMIESEENLDEDSINEILKCTDYDEIALLRGYKKIGEMIVSNGERNSKSIELQRGNDSITACSDSKTSISSKTTNFVSSSDGTAPQTQNTYANKNGSKHAKTRLRALSSLLDPRLGQKICNRHGMWGGDFVSEAPGQGVEVEYNEEYSLRGLTDYDNALYFHYMHEC